MNLFNFESATEIARHQLQDRIFSEAMTFFPSRSTNLHRAIDIGCGTGGWAIDLARQIPQSMVIGIDDSSAMITYASDQAMQHGLKNCQFKRMDALKPLPFPDQCFDLVNIRAMSTAIPRKMWPRLLEECHRITRAGGTLQLIECGGITTNSTALDEYSRFYALLLDAKGEYGFSTLDGFGMTPHMGEHLLLQAGYQNITSQPFLLDFSAGTDWHDPQSQCIEAFCPIVQPALVQAQITTPYFLDKTYAALRTDLIQETFQGFLSFPLMCGERMVVVE